MTKTQAQEQQELQQMILELNILDARFREMQQQMTMTEQQLNELRLLEKNIDELAKIKKDSETLSQLGQGIFVKSKIKNSDEVFVDIGSKIVLKKTPEEAKGLIKKRTNQVMQVRNLVMQEMNKIILNIQLIEKEIQVRANKG